MTGNDYRKQRRDNDVRLIKDGVIFNGDKGKRLYFVENKWLPKADLLMNSNNNLYRLITEEVISYFDFNKIKFHHLEGDSESDFCIPSGHTLSSQVSCLNHLYPLRYDKEAVLAIAQMICPEIEDVMQIETDKFFPAYISFEVVSDNDHLNERSSLRGSMCTSIDALIYGKHKDGTKILIPIEWKYTEKYHENEDLSIQDRVKGDGGKRGVERLKRYPKLIDNSKQLKALKEYKGSVYFHEPFYQLMRQTLWAEQMCDNKNSEIIKADDFIHAHIIPEGNTELLEHTYKVSGAKMEKTWTDRLKNQDKYKIISPEKLLSNIDKQKHSELTNYLSLRYWK